MVEYETTTPDQKLAPNLTSSPAFTKVTVTLALIGAALALVCAQPSCESEGTSNQKAHTDLLP